MDEEFEKYAKELEELTKDIPMKKAISATRHGIFNKVVDKIIISRFFWTEAFAYISILQTLIIFTALIPQSVSTLNDFFIWAHIPIVLPVGFSSVFTVVFIVFIFVFGYFTVRFMRSATVGAEYGAKTSPGYYLLWRKLERIEERLDELEKK